MTDAHWSKLRDIVGRAMELPVAERSAFLDGACGDDEVLRAQAEQLLAIADEPGFLESATVAEHDEAGAPPVERLGEFELVRQIGAGGMAAVYLARQPSLGREVAVKIFRPGLAAAPSEIERFHREARSVAQLQHPGIVQVYSEGKQGDLHYFAMELVIGHDLRKELQLQLPAMRAHGAQPLLPSFESHDYVSEMARIAAEAAEALAHAHGHGIVHRDIKPANLLLRRQDRRVQLVDFGLARDEKLGTLTRTGAIGGTPQYMSPEQARVSKLRVDHRTDVYSLGVVLYELLTRKLPFEGTTFEEIRTRITNDEARPVRACNARVPRDLDIVCAKAMAKDARERYQSADALAADLRRFLRHEAIEARPPSWRTLSRRWLFRHRRLLLAATLLLAGGALGIALASGYLEHKSRARLSVLVDRGLAADAQVHYRRIDPVTGTAGPIEVLGVAPLDEVTLEPGYYRVQIDAGAIGLLEYTRSLRAGQATTVRATSPAPRAAATKMVKIEAGTLLVADDDARLMAIHGREIPVETFWLDEAEVTNRDYRAFLATDQNWKPPVHWSRVGPEHDDLPVVYVSWQDALAYAEWVGKRLPSFPEWMWAARGPQRHRFPWGDDGGGYRGNTLAPRAQASPADGAAIYFEWATPVLAHPTSRTPSGLHGMLGNVREWTESIFAEPVRDGFEPRPAERLVAGSWWAAQSAATPGHTLTFFGHLGTERNYAQFKLGFRCARSAASPR